RLSGRSVAAPRLHARVKGVAGCPQAAERATRFSRAQSESKSFQGDQRRVRLLLGGHAAIRSTMPDACWIKEHLGGHDTQTTSLRAIRAVEQYAFGKRGRPRFRRFNAFNSIDGKEAKSTITFRDKTVAYGGLKLPTILDPSDVWQGEALKVRTKYCRIIRR